MKHAKMENIMKLLKYMLPLVVAFGFTAASAHADCGQGPDSRFDDELNERDWNALKNYLNTKRTIDLAEKSCNLTISGDVRTEWRHLNEKQCGKLLRGGNATNIWDSNTGRTLARAGLPVSRNDFDIEFNLRFEYVCNNAWAVAHVEYDNSAGVDDSGIPCRTTSRTVFDSEGVPTSITTYGDPNGFHGSGNCCDLCLKQAYIGYNLCCSGASRLDIELGRRGNMYKVFDSQVQFLQRLDGVLLTYTDSWECFADWYFKAAGFVIDERVNQFGFVTEFGFLNIMDTGFDFKYSFIDWRKNGTNRCFQTDPVGMKFLNSQFTLYYHLCRDWTFCMPSKLFGAFVWNHNGNAHTYSRNQNIAWYIGFEIGEVVHAGDWAFQTQYQYVQAYSIPDMDVSGIGRGNVLNDSVSSALNRGNTNYKGWRFEFLYALTDNLTVDTIYEFSREIKRTIGGEHHYSKFEVEAIYAF